MAPWRGAWTTVKMMDSACGRKGRGGEDKDEDLPLHSEIKQRRGSSDLRVGVCGLQLKLRDGLPHSFLDPHAWNLEQGQGVVHGLDSNVEGLRNLERTLIIQLLRKEGLKGEYMIL